MANEPVNIMEAVLDHVQKGLDPFGERRSVSVSNEGDVLVTGRMFRTQRIRVPGIGAGVAYAAGDAFGTSFQFVVPTQGIISNVVLLDFDDEGIQKDLVLFKSSFTETADNAAFAVSDVDLENCVGVVTVNLYYNFANNQVGVGSPTLGYYAPDNRLWCQVVTQGADNIAAGSEPQVFLVIAQ